MGVFIFCIPFPISSHTQKLNSIPSQFIELRVTVQEDDYRTPWRKKNPTYKQGIAIYLGNNQVLVPSHIIRNYTMLEGRSSSQTNPVYGTLLRVDNDLGLAFIQFLQPGNLFQNFQKVTFQKPNSIGKNIRIFSLDTNGLVTKSRGILGKLQISNYPGGRAELPYWEITSNEKLNGNGELVTNPKGEVIGILMEFNPSLGKGKVIPYSVIHEFIKGKKVHYHKGFYYRPLLDDATKIYYKMPQNKNGVLVSDILLGGSADGILQKEDIVLEIMNYPLDGEGQIQHPYYGRIGFPILFMDLDPRKATKQIPIQILREGKVLNLQLPLKEFPEEAVLIPFEKQENVLPGYLIVGGLVFVELTEFLLKEAGRNWRSLVDKKMLYNLDYHKFRKDRNSPERLVYLISILPDEENNGYHNFSGSRVVQFHNIPIHNLHHLYELTESSLNQSQSNPFWKIVLENGNTVVFETRKLPAINQKIQQLYQIPQLYLPAHPNLIRQRIRNEK